MAAFDVQKYTGNQLAVFRGAGQLSPDQMQRLAREINFSETTFIQVRVGGKTVLVAQGEFV